MENKNFLGLFKNKKPIIAMLHLKGDSREDVFNRFKNELNTYVRSGVDAVIVETYYGDYDNMVDALEYLSKIDLGIPYGINCLNVDHMGFYLAKKYNASFVQVDSVVGHVKPRDEATIQAFFDVERSDYDGCLIGGVRFKYQPMLSVNSLEEDLKIATGRCDGICVTQDRTGQETSMAKIVEFRNYLNDFPLIVAAGVTRDNLEKSLSVCDAAIVGSYFKDNYKDEGEVCEEHVKEFMETVRELRNHD